MRPPGRSRDAINKRFQTNMRRIGAISKALPALAGDEGVRADIIRASVVLLHATLEDFIRSSLPKQPASFTFNSRSDLIQALHRMRVGPKRSDDLMVPLTSLAKRRIQIVHYADLGETEVEAPVPWTSGDNMVLIHWHLAVASFVYRVRRVTGPVSLVEDRAGQNCTKARAKLFEFADLISSLSIGLPRGQIVERAEAAGRALDNALGALKLEVEMFLDAGRNPLPGAVPGSKDQGRKG